MAETTNTLLSLAADRRKYFMSTLDHTLRNNLVAEKICLVDRTDNYKIESPYSSTPTVEVSLLRGTFTPAAWTVTDDTLTVNTEFKVGEHVYDYERIITQFDMIANRIDQQAYAIANAIDIFVLNNLTEDATGSYSTPAGGFTTAPNINTIVGNLHSKVAGYGGEITRNGLFLVIEATDLPGFIINGMATGFASADRVVNGGLSNSFSFANIDVYVVPGSTFTNDTQAAITWTNSGHRVFGVKDMATYAAPRSLQYSEIGVTGKTGMECRSWGTIGFKLWATKASLIVDITIV